MKILAIEHETPNTPSEAFEPHLRAEAAQVWDLHQRGIIREMYFRADRPVAVLVLECQDVTAAETHLSTLPLVQHRLITFELIPLRAYPGLARLWEGSDRAH